MFDIPELDDMVILQLNRHDLAQCSRVSRTWHRIVVPYLWAVFDCSIQSQRAFYRLVRESYLLERQSQELQAQDHSTEQHAQESTLPMPLLAKYGRWIRQLPCPDSLWMRLQSHSHSSQPQQGLNEGENEEPTNYDLMRHLYKHCPALQVHRFRQISSHLGSDNFLKTISEHIIPRTQHLHLYGDSLEIWRPMYLLDHGSNVLESLTIDVTNMYSRDDRGQEEAQKEAKPWILKQLSLLRSRNYWAARWFWSWLWKRCGQVEQLEVVHVRDLLQILVEGIRMHMPNLDKLILRESNSSDNDVAALLSSSHHGWREITLRGKLTAIKGPAMEVLMQQCPVLEKLVVDRCEYFPGGDTVRVLASSPNLHTLIDSIDHTSMTTRIHASIFADRYPHTGSLREWACEASLTSLRIRITGVPRPDVPRCRVLESHPGQGREIQSQVYDRLARLTKLESLWLGERIFPRGQFDCLELSLESGLHKLSGLKSLKELGVVSLALKVGVEEVQWMTENWPELRTIYGMGLPNESPYKEAVEWLQRNRPDIRLK
ncbi:MAG: hypothetical protein J3Q66DRAFT_58902 [Benniella sp.]|nr:MAG: hypothetical protein J3Q66DRAFT_58902 [Benniella sp.]